MESKVKEDLKAHNRKALLDSEFGVSPCEDDPNPGSLTVEGLLTDAIVAIEDIEDSIEWVWMKNDVLHEHKSMHFDNLTESISRKLSATHRDLRQMIAEWKALKEAFDLPPKERNKLSENGAYSKPVPRRVREKKYSRFFT